MRLNPLTYLGDSIPRRGSALLDTAGRAWDAAGTEVPVVRSNITVGHVPEFTLDIAAIEREARAAQSAWIASALKSYFADLARGFSRAGEADRGEWPASPQSPNGMAERDPAERAPLPRPTAPTFKGFEMNAMTDQAADWSSIYARLDTLPISEYDRWQAKEGLRNAERIIELVLPVAVALRAIVHGVEHAAVSIANGIKTIFAKPVKH